MKRWNSAWIAVAVAFIVPLAQAQTNVRVRGTITAVGGDVVTVKSRDGRDLKLEIPADASVAVAKAARFEDIKLGDYVGTTTNAVPDGKLRAPRIQVIKDGVRPPQ